MRALSNARQLLGVALIVVAVFLYFSDLAPANIFVVWLLVIVGAGVIIDPRRILEARRNLLARRQAFLQSDPESTRLERLSRWLRWAMIPISVAVIYVMLKYIPGVGFGWMVAIAVLLFLPSPALAQIVTWRQYRTALKKQKETRSQ